MFKCNHLFIVSIVCQSLFATVGIAQQTYNQQSTRAHDLYRQKQYIASAKAYSAAFAQYPDSTTGLDRYNAACSWALTNSIDSAFSNLQLSIGLGFLSCEHISRDSDLISLHTDSRWQPALQQCVLCKENLLNRPLMAKLAAILHDDQVYRQQVDSVRHLYGVGSVQWNNVSRKIHHNDSINLVNVIQILDNQGWPSRETVGDTEAALFLVIQHSPLEVQEKYLPMLREVAKKDRYILSNITMLIDRIAVTKGQKQLYGTQLTWDEKTKQYVPLPIEDETNVDKRRAANYMPSLADYLKYTNEAK